MGHTDSRQTLTAHAPQFDDEQLLAGIVITDPAALEEIDGLLTDRVPEFDGLPMIERQIEVAPEFRDTCGYLPCAHCDGRPKFWRGYVMVTSDGQRFQVGQHCAAEHYEIDFEIIRRTWDKDLDRSRALQRLERVRGALPGVRDELTRFRRQSRIDLLSREARRLHDEFGPAIRPALNPERQPGEDVPLGELRTKQRVRDYDAERRRESARQRILLERTGLANKRRLDEHDETMIEEYFRDHRAELQELPEFKTTKLWTEGWVKAAKVAGLVFVQRGSTLAATIDRALRSVETLSRAIDTLETEKLSPSDIRKQLHRLGDALERTVEQVDVLRAANAFFDPPNLKTFAGWAVTRHPAGAYRSSGRTLERKAHDGRLVSVEVGRIEVPDLFETRRLIDTINAKRA